MTTILFCLLYLDYDNYPILSVVGLDRMHGNDHRKKQYLLVLQILFLCYEN